MKNLSLNPWLRIWIFPRRVIREIVDKAPSYGFNRLCWIYGFVTLLHLAINMQLGNYHSFWSIVIAAIILAWPVGYILFSIFAALFYWTGKWVKGQGNYHQVRSALMWANTPLIITIITWIACMVVYGPGLFTTKTAVGASGYIIFFQTMMAIQFIIGIYSFILLLHTLAEVQQFASAWISLLNVVFVWIVLIVISLACLLVTYVMMSSSTVAMIFIK